MRSGAGGILDDFALVFREGIKEEYIARGKAPCGATREGGRGLRSYLKVGKEV